MKPKGSKDNPWRAAGLVGVMGLDIAVCLYAGYWLGDFAARRFNGSSGWIALGLFFGLAVGIGSVIFLVKRVLEDSDG